MVETEYSESQSMISVPCKFSSDHELIEKNIVDNISESGSRIDEQCDEDKEMASPSHSNNEEQFNPNEETENNKLKNEQHILKDSSILSSSSSVSSASISPNSKSTSSVNKSFQPLPSLQIAAEWYKQYEDRLLANRPNMLSANLQHLKPPMNPFNNSRLNSPNQQSSPIASSNQTTPQSTSVSSNDSSLLMERFYSQQAVSQGLPFSNIMKNSSEMTADKQLLLASQQALLAQYAQFYSQNNGSQHLPASLLPMLSQAASNLPNGKLLNHSQQGPDSYLNNESSIEKDRYLASMNLYHQTSTSSPLHQHSAGSFNPYQFNRRDPISHRINSDLISPATPSSNNNTKSSHSIQQLNQQHLLNRGDNSSGSRSPSPTSSQLSGNAGCDEDEDDCDDSQSINAANGEWTYEEQFKQLYELSDDQKRKDFLDDLFAYMQKRGSPVNRIPIMAKHVLDLYELYRLVVAKGGLVEVINKKLWREITKGLNLPSSITSAAFTLRTQYMKYLYPYECEKLKMSSPSELQAAIDGNRREGRRPIYGFEYSSPTGINNNPLGNTPNMVNPNTRLPKQNELPHHHPMHMLPHGSNQHHAASFFAALAAQHSAQNQFFGSETSHPENNLHSNNSQTSLMPPAPSAIPPFLKPFYFDMNTPPASSSSSSTSSSSSQNNRNETERNNFNQNTKSNIENETENSTIASQSRSSSVQPAPMKRPFDHLDQNSDSSPRQKPFYLADTKEPLAKKLQLDCSIGSIMNKSRDTTYSASLNQLNPQSSSAATQSSKMKMKILSKDNDLTNGDKAISITIEMNGSVYKGTLFANEKNTDTNNFGRYETAPHIKSDVVY